MTENEAKEYMENEVECIKRASHCDRDCLKCGLVKEEEPLIESYKMAIQVLEEIQQYRAYKKIFESHFSQEALELLSDEVAERKKISKKARFEVFKRDNFTCQYCGRSAPDVTLEVDHIKPVSKGGNNSMLNLVTACLECNRGKTNIELSDDSVVKKQEKQLKELSERREQLDMLLEWRAELSNLEEDCVQAVIDIFLVNTDWGVSEHGKRKIRKWLKEFSLKEVLEATETAIEKYYTGTENSWNNAFNKVSGICYTKRKQSNDSRYYYANYTIKATRGKCWYCDDEKIRLFIFDNVRNDEDFEKVKACLKISRNWSNFRENMERTFNSRFLRRYEDGDL